VTVAAGQDLTVLGSNFSAGGDLTLGAVNAVQEAHSHWDHQSQGLSAAASAIIAIVVAAVTAGAGLGAALADVAITTEAGVTTATVAGTSVSVSTAMAVGAAANAGLATLISQATVSLINNQGDLGKTFQQLGSLDTVKNIAISMAAAGALSEVGSATDGHFDHVVTNADGTTSLVNRAGDAATGYFGTTNYFANALGHAAVGCAQAAASGGSCASGAAASGLSATATPLSVGSGFVGGLGLASGIGGTASVLTGGSLSQGAINGAYGYLYNDMAAEMRAWGAQYSGQDVVSAIGEFLQKNLGATFYAGRSVEVTMGKGATVGGGIYIDTNGNRGFFVSSAEMSGYNVGANYMVGYQFDTAVAFKGNTALYNISSQWGSLSITTDPTTGEFNGAALGVFGKTGASEGLSTSCIHGNVDSGC
jgi:hypothetical protein